MTGNRQTVQKLLNNRQPFAMHNLHFLTSRDFNNFKASLGVRDRTEMT